jgi:hypothetical protein
MTRACGEQSRAASLPPSQPRAAVRI